MRCAALAAALLLAGCASSGSQVVFLDGENGAPPGAVAVLDPRTGEERAVIERADTRARVSAKGARQRALVAERAEDRDGALIKELPDRAISFPLYYAEDSTVILPSSRDALTAMFAEVKRRPGVDIQIVGHTDRLGPPDYNDDLSRRRAEQIRLELVREGIDPAVIRATGRGERDAKGVDQVADPEDRYVEAVVR